MRPLSAGRAIVRDLAQAGMAELVDAADSKSAAARCGGSSPPPGTSSNRVGFSDFRCLAACPDFYFYNSDVLFCDFTFGEFGQVDAIALVIIAQGFKKLHVGNRTASFEALELVPWQVAIGDA